MFDCFVMLEDGDTTFVVCNDSDTILDMQDESYGCCDCGTTEDLEFVEFDKNSVWLQCRQCAHESFCESRDCARNDNYGEE